jgi:hypothetical protein
MARTEHTCRSPAGECSHVVRSGARDAAEVLAALGYMLCHVIERFGR